jgi:hypothetical protein
MNNQFTRCQLHTQDCTAQPVGAECLLTHVRSPHHGLSETETQTVYRKQEDVCLRGRIVLCETLDRTVSLFQNSMSGREWRWIEVQKCVITACWNQRTVKKLEIRPINLHEQLQICKPRIKIVYNEIVPAPTYQKSKNLSKTSNVKQIALTVTLDRLQYAWIIVTVVAGAVIAQSV